ncbi:MAG: hypothetical protein K0R14_662 [Burkholderiales bacterium]|jgi:hypothetical protein|nr:hypothetical protein [Burkholderiales bacterium]
MFYVVYNLHPHSNKQAHIYNSLTEFNNEWIPKFKKYCIEKNTDAVSLGAKCDFVPLGEDEVTLEPTQVPDFSTWTIRAFTKEELKSFLSEFLH